ncbi:MAG: tyrosine--tRNA ligase [Gemmatimonadetes bacterium]|nr:tyrosine--tRNA ligase [Gemmatimonadota bacterium]
MTTAGRLPLLDELRWRGMLYQSTEGAAAALASPTGIYCGFDPTAPSLHVGNLIPIMGLVHAQRAGHKPVALVGGGTGMIGDPGGRTSERPLLDLVQIEENVAGIRTQLERFLDFSGGARGAQLLNNAAWLRELKLVDFLRNTGKHFSVNWMLAKDSVASRLEGGISFTEFSYMLLQAYDFLELNQRAGVTVQLGGSDQWGNILAGTELLRRARGVDAHAVTFPLMTTASGAKFGKSEGGAVWLDAERTSPYRFYQFWINSEDADTAKYLKLFTLKTPEEIREIEAELAQGPEERAAQRALARDVTARVHGAPAVRAAEQVTEFLFGSLAATLLDDSALSLLAREIPCVTVVPTDIVGVDPFESQPHSAESRGNEALERLRKAVQPARPQYDALKLLTLSGLAVSNGAAKRLLEQGGVTVNRNRLSPSGRFVFEDEVLLRGEYVIVGKGRRDFAMVRVRS